MPDIEVMITSNNFPIFKDTSEFLDYSNQATFLIVPNTTYQEDYEKIKGLNPGGELKWIKESSIINDRISTESNLMGFTELPTYFIALNKGQKLKRQNLFRNK